MTATATRKVGPPLLGNDALRAFGVTYGPSLALDLLALGANAAAVRLPRKVRHYWPLIAAGAAMPWIYLLVIRPWHLHWGATDQEVDEPDDAPTSWSHHPVDSCCHH